MANVIRSSADEVEPLPRRLIYRRLLQGLQHQHVGWLFTRQDLSDEGILDDAVAKLRKALGDDWDVDRCGDGDVIVTRRRDVMRSFTSVERAFREPVRA